ncbi:MAG TPA: type II toxin-antitoxin system VapC family toxin [Frankiaceae bacterium]|nr:type II toxin-antitoxin system VapC family toxin [Frankiaceae bacterium]
MSVVLDTNVLVDVLRVKGPAVDYLRGLPATPVCSEASRIEVLQGMRSAERGPTLRLLATLDWHPVDRDVAERAEQLGREYRGSHGRLALADLCVAATAEVLGLPLATRNVKHFPMFPELRPAY